MRHDNKILKIIEPMKNDVFFNSKILKYALN